MIVIPALLTLLTAADFAKAVTADSLDSKYSCIGTFIFGRHNDRIAKPANYLTTLGSSEQFESGGLFRERYFGLDVNGNKVNSDWKINGLNEDGVFIYGETYAQCPVSTVVEYSQMSFLQGLYPPTYAADNDSAIVETQDSHLANGTSVISPLNGYQYVYMDTQSDSSDEYFRIKGDDLCPVSDKSIESVQKGSKYQSLNQSSFDFFQNLNSILPSKKFPNYKLNFDHSMDIYDFMNVNSIHDSNYAKIFNESIITQVKSYADQYQWMISYDDSNPKAGMTTGGRSILGAVYFYLNQTIHQGSPFINYFTGSFNNMYQLGGLLNLDLIDDKFKTMPDYGCTYVFDLVKESTSGEISILFSFKNGTQANDELTTYQIFNNSDSSNLISWEDFESKAKELSIWQLEDWCNECQSESPQCVQYSSLYSDAKAVGNETLSKISDDNYHVEKLTNAAAGGIGAGVTIGVILLLSLIAFALLKLGKNKKSMNNNNDISMNEQQGARNLAGGNDHLEQSEFEESVMSKEHSQYQSDFDETEHHTEGMV
ncbi:hypothetical protein DAMA08_047580 [Martiniozyma asiatica (nom. inval.)]|nr:hypothetical protein DAMA08_047580 [Martiniozyma asiatica]